ncbi:hypothetical protein OUZ56_015452 [Daphnia magna]|uniref:RING-type domain-containing protein n=1 Tax=Daphnia magna TaxID=35525 RepID=A0ABR0AMW7_9CRUS|nr:hypothetical protein OUZ56_015452 [Daphnia magna]
MSSVVSDDDAEVIDLVTCSVCLCEFDDANRKPKFLPCGHTICRTCLAEIQRNRQIQCPLCRKVHAHSGDVANLPSNNYALRLVREKNQNKASHESLLKLQAELEEMKDRRQTNWAETIGKRTEIQSYLFLVLNSIKNAEKEIQEKLEENGRVIVELTRQCEGRYERNSSVNPPREKPRVDKTLLELQSLMSSLQLTICPEDSKETIKEKMKTSVEESKQNLTLVSSELDNLQTWKKACLTIQAYNDTNTTVSPIWDTIIEMDWTRTPTSSDDLNLLLMSYMIFSVTKPCVAQDVLTLDTVLAEAHVSTNLSESKRPSQTMNDTHGGVLPGITSRDYEYDGWSPVLVTMKINIANDFQDGLIAIGIVNVTRLYSTVAALIQLVKDIKLPFAHHLVINALALDHLKFMVNSLQSLDRL